MQRTHEKYMERCLQLAELGRGNVAPNPMVGSVVVKDGRIVGEGYHQRCGEAHAEVNAIGSVSNQDLLKTSTLYVNLEPCSHWGKTPPCVDLIIEKQIPRVVIGSIDTHDKVCGAGLQKLRKTGIEVTIGILEKECRQLNARFYTFHERKRPYVILKWAQTQDGFIDIADHLKPGSRGLWITNDLCRKLVHKWRAEEAGIMVGTRTAMVDNPALTTRDWPGKNPVRIVADRDLKLDPALALLDGSTRTIVLTRHEKSASANLEYVPLEDTTVERMLAKLHEMSIQSVIVEGGSLLLQSFINSGSWDEARVFTGPVYFIEGVKAPRLGVSPVSRQYLGDSLLQHFTNESNKV